MGNKSRIGKKEEPSPSASEAEASFLEKIARHSLYPVHIIGAGSSYWELRIDKIGEPMTVKSFATVEGAKAYLGCSWEEFIDMAIEAQKGFG